MSEMSRPNDGPLSTKH